MKFIEMLTQAFIVAGMFFLYALLGTVMGAFTGWVVGLFFGKTILAILSAAGIAGFKMWQIGALLGFIGSFFRSVNINDNSH